MRATNLILKVVAILSLIIIPSLSLYGVSKEKAEMKFSETVHDFGAVKEGGGPVSVEFPFTNTGGANLVVYEAKADCGCTTPDYPKAPIPPGKGGKIKVTYNPLGRPGAFDKVITIKTNGKPGKVRLKIRGNVVPKNK